MLKRLGAEDSLQTFLLANWAGVLGPPIQDMLVYTVSAEAVHALWRCDWVFQHISTHITS